MPRLVKSLALLAAGILFTVHSSCSPVPALAPPGSTMSDIQANPDTIPAHGGVSVITVILTKKTGLPVPDGTVVQFFTTLGHIDEQGKSNDGVVRVHLVADGRWGDATITAVSGGAGSTGATTSSQDVQALGAAGTPTAAPTSAPTSAPGGGDSGGGVLTKTGTVHIGNLGSGKVIVSASPPGITNARTSRIDAVVIDGDGNFVPNIGVFFAVEGPYGQERLASGGEPVFTDNDGHAQDVLRTTANGATASYTAKVTVIVAGGPEGSVDVRIN